VVLKLVAAGQLATGFRGQLDTGGHGIQLSQEAYDITIDMLVNFVNTWNSRCIPSDPSAILDQCVMNKDCLRLE